MRRLSLLFAKLLLLKSIYPSQSFVLEPLIDSLFSNKKDASASEISGLKTNTKKDTASEEVSSLPMASFAMIAEVATKSKEKEPTKVQVTGSTKITTLNSTKATTIPLAKFLDEDSSTVKASSNSTASVSSSSNSTTATNSSQKATTTVAPEILELPMAKFAMNQAASKSEAATNSSQAAVGSANATSDVDVSVSGKDQTDRAVEVSPSQADVVAQKQKLDEDKKRLEAAEAEVAIEQVRVAVDKAKLEKTQATLIPDSPKVTDAPSVVEEKASTLPPAVEAVSKAAQAATEQTKILENETASFLQWELKQKGVKEPKSFFAKVTLQKWPSSFLQVDQLRNHPEESKSLLSQVWDALLSFIGHSDKKALKAEKQLSKSELVAKQVAEEHSKTIGISGVFSRLAEEDQQTITANKAKERSLIKKLKQHDMALKKNSRIVKKKAKSLADRHAEDYWGSLQEADFKEIIDAQQEERRHDADIASGAVFGFR